MENLTDEQKKEIIGGFVKITFENAIPLFKILGLETHFEGTMIDDKTGDMYKLSFSKIK